MRQYRWTVRGILLIIVLSMSMQARYIAQNAPSWCYHGRLNATEYTICTHASLSRLDRQLASVYGSAKAHGQDYGQRNWLQGRRDACGSNVECIRREYFNRIGMLQERIGTRSVTSQRPWCAASRLNTAERTICNSYELQNLDARLEVAYGQARARNNDYGQQQWLRQRDRCGTDRYCIARNYRKRIGQLRERLEPYRTISLQHRRTCSRREVTELKAVCFFAAAGEATCVEKVSQEMSGGALSQAAASVICNAAVAKIQNGSIDPDALLLSAVAGFADGSSGIKAFSAFLTVSSLNRCLSRAESLCGR